MLKLCSKVQSESSELIQGGQCNTMYSRFGRLMRTMQRNALDKSTPNATQCSAVQNDVSQILIILGDSATRCGMMLYQLSL